LDSLVAQRSDGTLIVGRGVPANWLDRGAAIAVTNFPTTNAKRLSLRISSHGRAVSLALTGQMPSGTVLFQLPSFVDNIARTSSGSINQTTGTVTLTSHAKGVTVQLRRAPLR
jgi:hypothetical protein